jgi:hypothetical protein
MRTAHDFDKATVVRRATEHPCPNCGAKAGIRCRIVSKTGGFPGYPVGTKVDVLPNPHPERCTLAWREMLNEEVATG